MKLRLKTHLGLGRNGFFLKGAEIDTAQVGVSDADALALVADDAAEQLADAPAKKDKTSDGGTE